MKSRIFIILCLAVTIVACRKDSSTVTPVVTTEHKNSAAWQGGSTDSTDTVHCSKFITQNIANTMISSYLASINASQNDSDIQSFSINADSLRAYLANPAITNVKLMFAHTMKYINAGNNGVYAGYQTGALTIVVAAYDANGNYIYYQGNAEQGNMVLDHLVPCPNICPLGAAGYNLLQ